MLPSVLLAACAIFVCSAAAQSPDNTDRASMVVLLKDLERATNYRDASAMLKYAHEEIVMISKNGEIVVGRKALSDYLDRMIGAAPSLQEIKTTIQANGFLAVTNDLMIVEGRSDDYYRFTSHVDLSIVTRWSAALVRDGAGWTIVALHFSFNLFDNPVLDAAWRVSYWVIGIAAALGLFVGVIGWHLINIHKIK